MKIKAIIVTVRGTQGEAMQGTFDAQGGYVAGAKGVKEMLLQSWTPAEPPKEPIWDSETPNEAPTAPEPIFRTGE